MLWLLAIATAAGGLTFTITGSDVLLKVIGTLVVTAVLFIVAALAEEALFRGYPLQTFTRARLFLFGAILTSVGFVAIHVANPNFKFGIPVVNLVIAGIWFAVAYWKTRSLWFPLGIHWAWNWSLTSLFGLPVSGITRLAPYPLLTGIDLGPTWLTGGNYGIEGGIACTVVLILSTVFIWRTRMVTATEEMMELTSRENPSKPVTIDGVLNRLHDSGSSGAGFGSPEGCKIVAGGRSEAQTSGEEVYSVRTLKGCQMSCCEALTFAPLRGASIIYRIASGGLRPPATVLQPSRLTVH